MGRSRRRRSARQNRRLRQRVSTGQGLGQREVARQYRRRALGRGKRAGAIGIASMAAPRAGCCAATPPAAAPPARSAAGGQGRGTARQPRRGRSPIATCRISPARKSRSPSPQRGAAEAVRRQRAHTRRHRPTGPRRQAAAALRSSRPLKAQASVTRETFESSNVAGLFEGSDPVLKSESSS